MSTKGNNDSSGQDTRSHSEDAAYWRSQYEGLLKDYQRLQDMNQKLEEKILGVVANTEFEKSTLMADVDKLSTKLVNVRIKLHDYEEKELLHASECDSPCHKNCAGKLTSEYLNAAKLQMDDDPNLV